MNHPLVQHIYTICLPCPSELSDQLLQLHSAYVKVIPILLNNHQRGAKVVIQKHRGIQHGRTDMVLCGSVAGHMGGKKRYR